MLRIVLLPSGHLIVYPMRGKPLRRLMPFDQECWECAVQAGIAPGCWQVCAEWETSAQTALPFINPGGVKREKRFSEKTPEESDESWTPHENRELSAKLVRFNPTFCSLFCSFSPVLHFPGIPLPPGFKAGWEHSVQKVVKAENVRNVDVSVSFCRFRPVLP